MQFCNRVLLIRTLYLIPFARYSASKISDSDLDLSGSPKVKYFYFFGKPICNFVIVFCWYELSISYRLRDIPHLRFRLVTMTFQDHRRSNISTFLDNPYGNFIMMFCWYKLSISYRLRDIPHLRFRLVTLAFQGHRKSNILTFLESPYGTL